MAKRLSYEFYARDSLTVARDLLGKRLVHRLPDGTRLSGRIVETEAYLGAEDPAAHSFGGRRTPRTEVMFGDPGLSYIYLIYGMYYCFNVVTTARDIPEAVLIRALDPLEGVEAMQNPQAHSSLHQLCNGPGKLCRTLHLTRSQNALDMTKSQVVWLETDVDYSDTEVIDGPRVGIGYAEDAVHWPLRFGVRNHLALSKPKFEP